MARACGCRGSFLAQRLMSDGSGVGVGVGGETIKGITAGSIRAGQVLGMTSTSSFGIFPHAARRRAGGRQKPHTPAWNR